MNSVLVKALVYLAAFIDLSDDRVVDPDAAAQQLENLGAILQELSQEERAEFSAYLQELARAELHRGAPREFVEFVSSFSEDFGLTD